MRRHCDGTNLNGEPCGQAPLVDSSRCFWHDPDHAGEAAEARRLGGLRRKREATLVGVYELDSLDSVAGLRRLLDIAAVDAVGLDNSIARCRVLVAIVGAGARLLEVGELEDRVVALEAAMKPRRPKKP
jgi:hypothetical protein